MPAPTLKTLLLAATASFMLASGPAYAQQNTVEVLHWWTAGGTAAAVAKDKEAAKAVGVDWKDVAIAGDGNQRTLLRARVMKGETLYRIMGDWAKAEFFAAKQEAGKDFHCVAVPGTENSFYFNTDSILFFKSRNDNPAAKAALAKVLMDTKAQEEFNIVKGSVPARTDADISRFDACAPKSYDDFKAAGKAGTLVPFPAMVLSAARYGAMTDVVIQFYAKPETATADVVARLLAASRT